jgi:peptide/nickel transport system permease protein
MSAVSPVINLDTPPPASAGTHGRFSRLGLTPGVSLAILFLLFLVIAAIAPGLVSNGSPDAVNLPMAMHPPSLQGIFGFDTSGRNVYTRLIYGARQSLVIGVGATAVGIGLGILLGFAAGLGGRRLDGSVNRFLEILFAFPPLLLALLFVAMVGPGVVTEIVAVGIGNAPGYARMIRGQVLAVKGSPYVEAAHALGHSRRRVIRAHIFPNAMRPLVVLATMGIGQSIVWASALSFLGLGVAPPAPEWGAMLDAGRSYITQAWWLEIFPGLMIVACALSLTTVGRYIQRRLEGTQA